MKITIEPTGNKSDYPKITLESEENLLDLDDCLIQLVLPALHCIGYDTSRLEDFMACQKGKDWKFVRHARKVWAKERSSRLSDAFADTLDSV